MDHNWSNVVFITKLSPEPQTSRELNALNAELVLNRPKCDLIVDLGAVDEPSYQTLCRLVTLCSTLNNLGFCCIFCNLSAATKRVFHLYGFDRIFQIAEASDIVPEQLPKQTGSGIQELRHVKNVKPMDRRKYIRLRIPSWLQVNVHLWLGGQNENYNKLIPEHSWQGRLVDISEEGAQVAVNVTEKTNLDKGQLIGVEFKPNHIEPMLVFDAQIREVLQTADERHICLGLQFLGLESNHESRHALRRLCMYDSIFYKT
jgi:anti-anti-sigma regulatory factor